jgi:hypothetical protein
MDGGRMSVEYAMRFGFHPFVERLSPMRGREPRTATNPDLGAPLPKEVLINSKFVIASKAKQSRMFAKSTASGSPRHFVPRDDGINQRFPNAKPTSC